MEISIPAKTPCIFKQTLNKINWPTSQSPQCTCPIFPITSLWAGICTLLFQSGAMSDMEQVGFVRLVYCGLTCICCRRGDSLPRGQEYPRYNPRRGDTPRYLPADWPQCEHSRTALRTHIFFCIIQSNKMANDGNGQEITTTWIISDVITHSCLTSKTVHVNQYYSSSYSYFTLSISRFLSLAY